MNWKPTAKALGGMKVAKTLKGLSDYDVDDALEMIGLRRRPNPTTRFLAGMGLVLGGLALGAVAGMALAPRMRQQRHQPGMSGGMRSSPPMGVSQMGPQGG
jgi:hypothetical protein